MDLHYDIRERGSICERDIFEARERACYIQNIFDGVCAECEHQDAAETDGKQALTVHFTLPFGNRDDNEVPMQSTLEREMGFACHHAIHHNFIVRCMAASGKTGLTLKDLPPSFGRVPSNLVLDFQDAA